MKKILLSIIVMSAMVLCVNAEEILQLPYKNIKEEGKLKIDNGIWTNKIPKKEQDYFIKFISDGSGNYSEFYNSDGSFAFTTDCQYEFLYKGRLIGYSNQDLKFYEFINSEGKVYKKELEEEFVSELFPDFKIIKISEFSTSTNSLKLKKEKHNLKVIILNDTDKEFYHYSFSSNNGRFEAYPLTGFINIAKKGMFQFSHLGDNTEITPWFILLVR